MKFTYKHSALLLIINSLLFISCSDSFLDRQSLVAMSERDFWKTEQDAKNALAACYDGLQDPFLYGGDPWKFGPLNMDCMTDNGGHFNWSGWMAGYDICNGIHTPSSWLVKSYWMSSYEEIKRCNDLIAKIEPIQMDDAQKAIYKAEAIVLRSLIYTNLTITYNDVPYLTSPILSIADTKVPKTDRETIVTSVINDLKDAANVLPESAPAWGRVTKGAALSVLGRLALYNKMWDEAINAYRQVKGLGYSLYTGEYKDLFTEANEQCSEIIMSVRYQGPGVGEGNSFGVHYDAPMEAMNGTIDLADAFYSTNGKPYTDRSKESIAPIKSDGNLDLDWPYGERYNDRDPRLKATLFTPYQGWKDNWAPYGGAAASYSTLYVMKYYNPYLNSSTSWDNGQDFYIIRYAEVLLSLAEALVEKGGYDYDEITGLIDDIRNRAHMPTIQEVEGSTSQLDQAGLREVIRHERRVETAFEGLRLFDLYRWKELENSKNRINKEAQDYGFWYEYRNHRGDMEYIWPIPQYEIDSNPDLEQCELWK